MDAFSIQKELLPNNENYTILDVGAHMGSVSLNYRDLFPNSTIYAFEPYEESFNILLKNTIDKNIKCYQIALGNIDGKIEFNVNTATATNSIFETHPEGNLNWENKGWVTTVEKQMVNVCTLDTFIKNNNIEKIDILKLDTQGTEYTIIEGAINSILENKIKIVYTEIITMPTYIGQKHLDEVIKLFRENNFRLYDIYNQSYTNEKKLRQVDAIFIHDSFNVNFKSQYGQDKYISSLVNNKRDGYFVELGACDGVMFSNSHYFEKSLGWNGVLIEPNPYFYEDLKKNRKCNISNKLCDGEAGKEIDFLIAGPISGVLNDKSGYWVKQNLNNQKIKLTTTTLSDVLDEFHSPYKIDFLSLDVEGSEYNILKTFPFDKYTFHFMCIEHNECYDGSENKNNIRELLISKGYTLIKESNIDDFYENKNFLI